MNLLDQLMDTAEAAEQWGISQDHVKLLCRQGKIICRKFGKSYVLLKDQPNPATRKTKIEEPETYARLQRPES